MNLFKLKPISMVRLAQLVRPTSPNTYFVCPSGFSISDPDQIAPVFPQSVDVLFSTWKTVAEGQPKTTELPPPSTSDRQISHVQRTALLGYPDVITAEVISMPAGGATIAIYSRSQYGHSDLGANQKRVNRWLSLLSEALA